MPPANPLISPGHLLIPRANSLCPPAGLPRSKLSPRQERNSRSPPPPRPPSAAPPPPRPPSPPTPPRTPLRTARGRSGTGAGRSGAGAGPERAEAHRRGSHARPAGGRGRGGRQGGGARGGPLAAGERPATGPGGAGGAMLAQGGAGRGPACGNLARPALPAPRAAAARAAVHAGSGPGPGPGMPSPAMPGAGFVSGHPDAIRRRMEAEQRCAQRPWLLFHTHCSARWPRGQKCAVIAVWGTWTKGRWWLRGWWPWLRLTEGGLLLAA